LRYSSPNAPVVGTPENRERSDQRLVVLLLVRIVWVLCQNCAISLHRNCCLESHFIRYVMRSRETG